MQCLCPLVGSFIVVVAVELMSLEKGCQHALVRTTVAIIVRRRDRLPKSKPEERCWNKESKAGGSVLGWWREAGQCPKISA